MEGGARYSVRDGGDVFGEEKLGVEYEPEMYPCIQASNDFVIAV